MVINEEVRKVIEGSPFLVLVTMNEDGNPHPIVAGDYKTEGGDVVFVIHGMKRTLKNLSLNGVCQVVAAVTGGKPQGVRLNGTARADGNTLIFTAGKAESLI
jgi:predicted pyridoxine 5'-phosphate oxidase superfamily flavin-nucleotide-binding protein